MYNSPPQPKQLTVRATLWGHTVSCMIYGGLKFVSQRVPRIAGRPPPRCWHWCAPASSMGPTRAPRPS